MPTPEEINAGLHGLKLVAADVITDVLPESMWCIIVRVILEEAKKASGNSAEIARLKHELAEAHEKIQQLRRYIGEIEADLAEARVKP